MNAANPDMSRQQQEQELFKRTAELLADDKITPEQACSFIETLRDAKILADDVLNPENLEQEKQKFNEIAGIYADWKISAEEACDLFKEWIGEWKTVKNWKKQICGRSGLNALFFDNPKVKIT